ncbi:putative Eukaryotic initiation factor 4E [Trypanosoma vivax]|uniref:Uncharacterized protein n=1 Tax=Trypanosoma vivax (strain Y486) TaxID=1055687 RepID=G0U6F3_TRYVY|nr:hypothetical protein TRVL_08294 [Trypanosoma vivax]KAH8611188.1 putative Eukaryotic initiation factor 4E [Trypanosoma vivax]CCC51457.1 conserved hypothetical protein [Trypanosoma vivax Y486]
MEDQHELKDPWFLSYIPPITPEMVKNDFKDDWNLAKQELEQQLDYILTVEELWSTINSLPKIHQLARGSTFVFARKNVDAIYEAFPNGTRIIIDMQKTSVTLQTIGAVFGSVIGEGIARDVCEGKSVCDVLRLSPRASYEAPELVRLELWLNDQSYGKTVLSYIKKAVKEAGVHADVVFGESKIEKLRGVNKS